MVREVPVGFDHTLTIAAPAARVLGAFFDPHALGVWWQVERAIVNPTPLGAYAIAWPRSETVDALLGPLGGTFHGTVIDYKPGRAFFVAEAYWVPPRGDPIGPRAFEVTAAPPGRLRALVGAVARSLPPRGRSKSGPVESDQDAPATSLRVVQSGYEESERWRRYYELLGVSLPAALERLKTYVEKNAVIPWP